MQINDLKRKTANKKSVQVGRGGKRGKTAGRGTKGQLARAGRKLRPELRDIIKKLPKLRGRGKNSFLSIQTKPVTINLTDIETNFKEGDKVSPSTLAAKGVVRQYKGKNSAIKILATGELTKKVTISGCILSETAKAAIEKAGGSVK
jgi:large subunit ribosomal protein L15